jgi:hypothetical protein
MSSLGTTQQQEYQFHDKVPLIRHRVDLRVEDSLNKNMDAKE